MEREGMDERGTERKARGGWKEERKGRGGKKGRGLTLLRAPRVIRPALCTD